jgi:hypothetical protein
VSSFTKGQDSVDVPEAAVLFYTVLFPDVLRRAKKDHLPAADGICLSCYQSWPCDIQKWVNTLSAEQGPTVSSQVAH